MKRENFDIYLNGEYIATKYAFNSAANKGVLEHLKSLNESFTLKDSSMEKADGFHASYGTRLWVRSDGEKFLFEIKLRG